MIAKTLIVAALLTTVLVASAPAEAAICHTEPGAPGALVGGYGNADTIHVEVAGRAFECDFPGPP